MLREWVTFPAIGRSPSTPAGSGTCRLKEDPLEAAARSPISVSIARQPIFDEKRRLWGYELSCVGSAETTNFGFPEESSVAVSLQSSAYLSLQQLTDSGKKIIVDFTARSIMDNFPHALPSTVA